MTQHTPGPWHTFEAVSRHGTAASVGSWLPNGQTRYLICETLDIPLDDAGSKMDHTIGLANARLIAAAPDLLAACRAQAELIEAQTRLLVAYRTGRRPSEKALDAAAKRGEIEAQARAAIAKAVGQ